MCVCGGADWTHLLQSKASPASGGWDGVLTVSRVLSAHEPQLLRGDTQLYLSLRSEVGCHRLVLKWWVNNSDCHSEVQFQFTFFFCDS